MGSMVKHKAAYREITEFTGHGIALKGHTAVRYPVLRRRVCLLGPHFPHLVTSEWDTSGQETTVNPPVLRWIMLGNMLSGITHTRGAIPLPSFRVSDNSGNSFRTAETADTLEVDRGMPF